jgi:hypothetical protein
MDCHELFVLLCVDRTSTEFRPNPLLRFHNRTLFLILSLNSHVSVEFRRQPLPKPQFVIRNAQQAVLSA